MATVRPRASRLAPTERRAQLLTCAVRVFGRRGLGRATHADVAAEAGVAVATVFVYFKTRGELVHAVLEEIERYQAEIADLHQRTGNPVPRALLDYAIGFATSVDTHPDHARVLLEWSTAVRDEIWPLYLGFHGRMVEKVAATVRRGQRQGTVPAELDPDDAALLLVSAAHVVAQMKLARQPAGRVHRFLLTLLRGAIGARAVAAALG